MLGLGIVGSTGYQQHSYSSASFESPLVILRQGTGRQLTSLVLGRPKHQGVGHPSNLVVATHQGVVGCYGRTGRRASPVETSCHGVGARVVNAWSRGRAATEATLILSFARARARTQVSIEDQVEQAIDFPKGKTVKK